MLHGSEFRNWLRVHGNRPEQPLVESAFWSLYEQAGSALVDVPEALREHPPVELLVVITTYRRPEPCLTLLEQLHATLLELSPSRSTMVLVFNDKSDRDYTSTRERARELFGSDLCWLDARERLGKPGFWRTYQTAFLAARALAPEHALFVQDDCQLASTLLSQVFSLWAATSHDALRRVLYLFSSRDDEWYGRWAVYIRRAAGAGLRKTQWFDLQAFFVDRAFFELLDYRMIPFHPLRWRRRPNVSSGVGWQLTVRLRHRANIYQTSPALVLHGALPSEMNPGARARRPLDNRK